MITREWDDTSKAEQEHRDSLPSRESLRHPNVHREWQSWSEEQQLHLVVVYFNPFRYRTRRQSFNDFVQHIRHTPNVVPYIVEIAYGDRPFEVTNSDDIQLRTDQTAWMKECGINAAVRRFPSGWRYGGYSDGDFHYTRHDWALEAVHLLQHYPFVQLFSGFTHMDDKRLPMRMHGSFAYVWRNYTPAMTPLTPEVQQALLKKRDAAKKKADIFGTPTKRTNYFVTLEGEGKPAKLQPRERSLWAPGATGGGWAWRRREFDEVNGLMDFPILGSSDWHTAFGLTGEISVTHPETKAFNLIDVDPESDTSTAYGRAIRRYQKRLYEVVKGNIGYVEQMAVHNWHGSMRQRNYGERFWILKKWEFDPLVDIVRDSQGLWRWAGNKPFLEQAAERYFLSRNEDVPNIDGSTMY